LALLLAAGAAPAAEMGGHGGSMGHGGSIGHAGGGFGRFGRTFHERRFHDGVAIVPFGFGYYAPYAGYYPYPPTAYDTYCNQLSPYYDSNVCWDYYGG
jgi:hypothetical protein